MATSWRDILPKVLAEREGRAVSSVSSVSPENQGGDQPNGPNGPNGELPADVSAGLAALPAMRCPQRVKADVWASAVKDAVRLVDGRWAGSAMRLGWSELDLFGAVPDPEGDDDADGLAVKLSGRRVLAICASFATVADANGGRSYLYRGNNEGARLLWELGRGR